jgi:4-aminobutyrate aminotransferase
MSSAKYVFNGIKRMSDAVMVRGEGCRVFTNEGVGLLDCTSGIAVTSTGHCHPTVVAAVRKQAGTLVHAQQSVGYSGPQMELVERLRPHLPAHLTKLFFANSGAEAVESAVRLARQATGRDNVVAMLGGYHGRTVGTLALTSSGAGYRGGRMGPMPGGTIFVPYAGLEGSGRAAGATCDEALHALDMAFKQQVASHDVAAILLEPVLGEGGYVPVDPAFMRGLRSRCDEHGIVLIADEIQSGFGRTGTMFACEQTGVTPDILVMAKGIASGYPISAIATSEELAAKQAPGSMGGTYGGNAVACAAAIGTLDVFEGEDVLANVVERSAQMFMRLRRAQARHPTVCRDVRGLGLMIGVDYDVNVVSGGFAGRLSQACLQRGMLLLTAGVHETVRFAPPLIITAEEVDEAMEIYDDALDATVAERGNDAASEFVESKSAGGVIAADAAAARDLHLGEVQPMTPEERVAAVNQRLEQIGRGKRRS